MEARSASEADVAAVAALLGHPARARCLDLLLSHDTMTAGALAKAARVSPASASQHLRKLEAAGLVTAEPRGPHRWYRLASGDVAHVLESCALIAPRRPIRSLAPSSEAAAFAFARLCYDHLAGRLAVALGQELQAERVLAHQGGTWVPGPAAHAWLEAGGIDDAA